MRNLRTHLVLLALLGAVPSIVRGEQGTVALEVTDQSGLSVASERYVAVFARGSRWTDPLREATVAAGEALPVWTLSPGRYMAFCSAAGFAYHLIPPFDVVGGDARRLRCELASLSRVGGRVISAVGGAPVGGARVAHSWLLDTGRLYRVSPVGEVHLAKNFSGTSDGDGAFSIGSVPGVGTSLWVEADGYAGTQAVVVGALADAASTSVGDVVLAAGGALEVRLTGTEQVAPGSIVALRKLDPALGGLDVGGRGRWNRPLPESGEAAQWRSLEPGRYEVWLRSPANAGEPGRPVVVGAYEVRAGAPTLVAASVPGALQRRDPDVVLRLPTSAATADVRVWRWQDGRLEQALASAQENPSRLLVPGACKAGAVTLLAGKHTVSPPYVFPAAACRPAKGPVVVEAELFPAGEVEGTLVAPFGFVLPATATLRVDRCAGEHQDAAKPLGTFPVTLADEGRWKALVPAGCANLSLRLGGFAPIRWEGVSVPAKAVRQLDSRRLEPGGSLLLRVVSGDDGRGLEGVRVDVVEESALGEAVKASLEKRSSASLAAGWTDVQGWARFDSLPAGAFALRAIDDEGRRLGFSRSFKIGAAQELVLPDLELASPGSLVLRAVSSGGGTPDRRDVRVSGLVNVADCGWELGFDAVLGPEGGWVAEVPDLLPGAWRLVAALTGDGEGTRVDLPAVDVELGPGETRDVELEIAGAAFNGIVTLHDQPVAGELSFRSPGKGSNTARTESDTNGRFSVLLPAPGRYDVVVIGAGLGVTVGGVELLDPEEVVRIELPAGAIEGRVVDDEGQPVPEAHVYAIAGSGLEGNVAVPLQAQATPDGAGRFRLVGLASAKWGISATAGDRRSGPLQVEVPREGIVDGIRLVVTSGTNLRGHVLVAGAPVAAATGTAYAAAIPLDVPGGLRTFRTDAEGGFEVDLGPGADGLVNVVITDPRLAAAAFLVSAPGESDFHMELVGGRVVLSGMGGDWQKLQSSNRLILVNGQGAYLTLGEVPGFHVSGGADEGSPRATLPNLAPGVWSLVPVTTTQAAAALMSGQGAFLPALAVFEVRRAATTEVDLPSSEDPAPRSSEER